MGLTYKESGVDIEAGYESVKQLTKEVRKTFNSQVLDNFGSFGALFMPDLKGISEPVLVSSTDGVGTKVLLAIEMDSFETIGIDLVGMCVNDIVTQGAKPLFMLDYIALNELTPSLVTTIIKGIVAGCQETDCALIGGETAEMRDVYKRGDFDLAGFVVGIVDKSKVIDGKSIVPGDVILGFPSSGAHSNGYSLARKIADLIPDQKKKLQFKQELLTPTKLYVRPVLKLLEKHVLKGLAHITGGGLYENAARVLPAGTQAFIKRGSWEIPQIFKNLQDIGQVKEVEMYRTFNMGIGMVMVVDPKTAEAIKSSNPEILEIGEIREGSQDVVIEGVS